MTDGTTTTDTAAAPEAAVPARSATETNETPTAGTGTPGERENGPQGDTDDSDDEAEPRGRAAKYRERAQAAEARVTEVEQARDELAGTVERLQRLHVEQAVERAGVKPAAVFAVADLGDLLGDDGLPDDAKVAAAIKSAREELGVKQPTVADYRNGSGLRSGAGVPQPRRDGWSAAFARRDD
ncbi:MAG: hypothetical protein ACRDNS_12910 [Trebonia sp.]